MAQSRTSPRTFMKLVGIIEIAAGIVGNLAIQRRYYDVALRDVGLAPLRISAYQS